MDATCEDVAGRLLHPVNPAVSVRMAGDPTLLLESSFLLMMAASLYQELLPRDLHNLPEVKRSEWFPYRHSGAVCLICFLPVVHPQSGKACFVCEDDATTRGPADESANSPCSLCGLRTQLEKSNPQRVLEHMAAHILYDVTINRHDELCGLCLRPATMCRIFIRKGRGTTASYGIDLKRSLCINLTRFNYASAARSSESSPCSNVPMICPLCSKDDPAVWAYNLASHFCLRHKLTPMHFPIQSHLSTSEREGLKKIWDSRFKVRATRNSAKSKLAPMMLSEAHSSRLALR